MIKDKKLNNIKEFRKNFNSYIDRLKEFNNNKEKIEELAEKRKFNSKTYIDANMIYIEKDNKLLVPEYIGDMKDFGLISSKNNKPIYNERYILPIYDMCGLPSCLVGYSLIQNEKYVYSNTKYLLRNDIMYGIENLENILEDGYAIVVEGIMDALRVRELGFNNVLSTLGSHKSEYHKIIFDIIPYIIFIPDRDSAGKNTNKFWKSNNRYARLNIPYGNKDIDDYCKQGEGPKEHMIIEIQSLIESRNKSINKFKEIFMELYDFS